MELKPEHLVSEALQEAKRVETAARLEKEIEFAEKHRGHVVVDGHCSCGEF